MRSFYHFSMNHLRAGKATLSVLSQHPFGAHPQARKCRFSLTAFSRISEHLLYCRLRISMFSAMFPERRQKNRPCVWKKNRPCVCHSHVSGKKTEEPSLCLPVSGFVSRGEGVASPEGAPRNGHALSPVGERTDNAPFPPNIVSHFHCTMCTNTLQHFLIDCTIY